MIFREKKAVLNQMEIKKMSKWTKNISIGGVFLCVAVFSLWVQGPLLAQQKPDAKENKDIVEELSTEMVGEEASRLLARINRTRAHFKRYDDKIKGASDEDRSVIKLQVFALQQQLMGDVHQLGDALLVQETKQKSPELRQQVEGLFAKIVPSLWSHINGLDNEIDVIRATRVKASTDERLTIEDKVFSLDQHLNRMFELGLSHIENMKKIGMDTLKVKENFARLLTERSEQLSGRIMLASDRVSTLTARTKVSPDDTEAAKLLAGVNKNLAMNTASMTLILGVMDTLELDTDVYRSQLIEVTRDITSGGLGTGVIVTLIGRVLERAGSWFLESGPGFLVRLLLFSGILLIFSVAKRLVRRGLDRILNASTLNLSQLAHHMIVSMVSNLVMILGLLIALSQLGISLGPLLAGLGVAGFIIGFALQDTLSNFASGVMILLYRPYDVDDLIDVGGISGKVAKMNLVSTSILTLDNQMIVIPNNKIWGDVIINITAQDIRRVDMVFGIGYSDDVSKAERVLNDILSSHQKVIKEPEPMVRLHTLGASSVDFIVRPWTKVDDYWDVYWEVTRAVKIRFDAENISIPFPQQDVHLYPEKEAAPSLK